MDAVAALGQRFIDNLCLLAEILEQVGLPFAVVGASAFLLHGIDLGRTTRDLDLAVAIEGGLDTAEMASSLTTELTEDVIGSLLETAQLTVRFANGETRRALVLAYRKGLRKASASSPAMEQ